MRVPLRATLTWSALAAALACATVVTLLVAAPEDGHDSVADDDDLIRPVLAYESDGLRYTYHVTSGSEALFDVRLDPDSLRNLLPGRALDASRLRVMLEKSLGITSLDHLREARRRQIDDLKALGYL